MSYNYLIKLLVLKSSLMLLKIVQPDESKTGRLDIANFLFFLSKKRVHPHFEHTECINREKSRTRAYVARSRKHEQ